MRFISGKYTSGELLDNVRAVEDWITNHFVERGPVSDEVLKSDMSKRLLDISFGRNDAFLMTRAIRRSWCGSRNSTQCAGF